MKALVTGATGLVGSTIVKQLLKSGYTEVIAIGRNTEKLELLEKLGANPIKFDLTVSFEKYDLFNKYLTEEYNWFHCAAAVSGADTDILQKVNIEGTHKIVKKAEEGKINKFIHISSIAVYGLQDKSFVETDKTLPESKYGYSKLISEREVVSSQLPWIVLRPPYIGGPGDINFLNEFSRRIRNKKMPLISRDGQLGYIDARDLANVSVLLSESDIKNEIFNVQGSSIYLSEFVNLLGSLIGENPPYGKKYPFIIVYTLGLILDILAKISGKNNDRGISRYRIKSLSTNRTLNINKIIKYLNFKPKYTIKQSIMDWLNTK